MSIKRNSDDQYWNGTAFDSTPEVFNSASGTASFSYALPGSNLTDGVSYTVRSRATDIATNAETTPTSVTFTFASLAPTVTFTGAPANAAFGSNFTVASTTNSSASPVYTSSGACTNVSTLYTMTGGTGTCTSTVTWAADANYSGATLSQTTTATTIAPTDDLSRAPPANARPLSSSTLHGRRARPTARPPRSTPQAAPARTSTLSTR